MDKELEEALRVIKIKCHPNSNPSPLVDGALEKVKKILLEYEQIKNANPSKALECLEVLFDILCEREHTNSEHNFWLKNYNTIRQALITKSKKELAFDLIKKKMFKRR